MITLMRKTAIRNAATIEMPARLLLSNLKVVSLKFGPANFLKKKEF
jgi:hypothetical protein